MEVGCQCIMQCHNNRSYAGAAPRIGAYLIDKICEPPQNICKWLVNMPSDDIAIFVNSDKKFCFYQVFA